MIECMNPLYMTHRLNDSKGSVGMTLSFFLTILVSLGGELMKYFRLVTFYISVEIRFHTIK